MRGPSIAERRFRRIAWTIPAVILLFGGATVAYALAIGSRQLLKDGLDWGYDVALYGIAAFVFGRGPAAERATAGVIGAIMAVAGAHTLYDLWDKALNPRPIEPFVLGFSAASAVVIALLIVGALFSFRKTENPLIAATWLSSRNDAVSTTVYAALGLTARLLPTRWPEYALDIFSAGLAFQAAGAIALTLWRDRRDRAGVPA